MAVKILNNEADTMACLYCSTSDWAFGPVFSGDPTRDKTASERALDFCNWFNETYRQDPRKFSDTDLERAYLVFCQFEHERGHKCSCQG